jgi:hypothetical protein
VHLTKKQEISNIQAPNAEAERTRGFEMRKQFNSSMGALLCVAYFSERANYNQEMLDLRYQLKDQLTREEWQQVFASD